MIDCCTPLADGEPVCVCEMQGQLGLVRREAVREVFSVPDRLGVASESGARSGAAACR